MRGGGAGARAGSSRAATGRPHRLLHTAHAPLTRYHPAPSSPAPRAVYINNSDVARLIIKNMTQGRALAAMKAAPPPADASQAEAAAAELLQMEVAVSGDP